MESAPNVEGGFSPLDEQLELVAGQLTPRTQDHLLHLVHLATGMPFGRAVQMLTRLSGVQLSEATARRYSYRLGTAAQTVQIAVHPEAPASPGCEPESKQILSVDGAMVSLLHGQWAEVKTVVVGCVEAEPAAAAVHSRQLSYFSRRLDATTFCEQATAELLRRGIDQAKQVCAVMDGAEWIDGFVDWQRKDALRILDFAHAAEYVSAIGELARAAGTVLADDWLSRQLQQLKHEGPRGTASSARAASRM